MVSKLEGLPLGLLALLSITTSGDCARILALFPIFAPSHQAILKPTMKALALAGHEVVVYTPLPLENPPSNYTNVVLDMSLGLNMTELNKHLEFISKLPQHKCLDLMLPLHEFILHPFFNNEAVQKLLRSNEKFDVLFTETFVAQEYLLYFAEKFVIPSIGIQTYCTSPLHNWHMGNSLSLTSVPDGCFGHSDKMTFVERFLNAFSIIRGLYIYFDHYLPLVESKFQKYIPNAPPLVEMTKRLSLMFTNDHFAADYARPRPPNMIPIAGIHLTHDKTTIPENIKTFMDGAENGVILFTLGILESPDSKPKEYYNMLMNVFKKCPQRVLWLSQKENVVGLPENVMVVKWVPQQEILEHPKCVLFITHGDMASQIETIHAAVPVVGVPHYADQHRNVGFFHASEIGVRVLSDELSEETLSAAVHEALTNPKYKENMRRMSQRFRDRPMTPAQSVVFWTEHVIRHSGAAHLKPSSTELFWYQIYLLDILVAILATFLIILAILYILVRRILYCFKRRNTKMSLDKKRD